MHPRWKPHLRAAIEISFIIFLFYSNLLMGEFTAAAGRGKSLSWALADIFRDQKLRYSSHYFNLWAFGV
jgi:hypothetical protein